jgi:hypothetical protein
MQIDHTVKTFWRVTALCLGITIAVVSSTQGSTQVPTDCMLTNVVFPRGNLLSWMASLHLALSAQSAGPTTSLTLNVSLPAIRNATTCTDEATLQYLTTNTIAQLTRYLNGDNTAYGIAVVHDSLHVGVASLTQLLELLQTIFRCRVDRNTSHIQVRWFPQELVIYAFTVKTHSNSKDILAAVYGEGHDPFEGILYPFVSEELVYVLAPRDRHELVLQRLAGLKAAGVSCPSLRNAP